MAVYEESEITAELINSNFPTVAEAIIANANVGMPEITAESIVTNYPLVASELKLAGFNDGRSAGIEAESTRIAEIDALSIVGYDAIIKSAREDGESTANDVKIKVMDAQLANNAMVKENVASDGVELASQVEELVGATTDENDTKKEAEHIMAVAGKKVRGEK